MKLKAIETWEARPPMRVLMAIAFCLMTIGYASAAELVIFEAKGCPWCAAWHREVGPGYPLSSEGQFAPLRRVAIDDTSIKLQTPVRASPTFVLVEQGLEIGRITGYPGADFFWSMLGQLIVKLENTTPNGRKSALPDRRTIAQTLLEPSKAL
jgi:hypothetical protein